MSEMMWETTADGMLTLARGRWTMFVKEVPQCWLQWGWLDYDPSKGMPPEVHPFPSKAEAMADAERWLQAMCDHMDNPRPPRSPSRARSRRLGC